MNAKNRKDKNKVCLELQGQTPNEVCGQKLVKAPYGATCTITDSCFGWSIYAIVLFIFARIADIGGIMYWAYGLREAIQWDRVYAEYGGVFHYVGMWCTDLYDGQVLVQVFQ